MAKYQAYPEYKDSGIEWLGEIPNHWITTELKRYSTVQGGYAFNSNNFTDSGKAIIRIGDIKQDGNVSLNSCKYIKSKVTDQYSQYQVHRGDLLMAMTGATIGKAGWFKENKPALLNQRVGLFKCNKSYLNYKFFWYVLNSLGYQEYIKLTAFGGAQPNISDSGMVGYQSTFPLKDEQQKITNFLDHETAKIDTLIEKQQQLIKLLKEKRQAVISHAVTKGLNPNVPMRDSGVEWLGEVPEHWIICTLNRYADFVDGDRGSEYPNEKDFRDKGILFLSSKNIVEEKLDLTEVKFISQEKFNVLNRGKARNGDLIVKVRGSVGRIGELAKFETAKHGYKTAFINAQMMIIRNRKGLITNYLRLISQSLYWTEQLAIAAYGTAQKQLSNTVFSNLYITVPPESEQMEIEEKLQQDLSAFSNLIGKAQKAIVLMQERRTALISAAVTGKIDVRNWQVSKL